jgi:superfamily I DNA/RNA helicase
MSSQLISESAPPLFVAPLLVPSPSQREAIEAEPAPLLVLAGPGAGKTFCLIERIRYLIEQLGLAPERLCAFTFTNKAAGEIADRLGRSLGTRAAPVKTGTIHAFCAELLREFGDRVGLERGFGIVDERQQRAVLRRLAVPPRWHSGLLSRFATHRFCGTPFEYSRDGDIFDRYQSFLDERNLVDFDQLILRTAELLREAQVVKRIAARWDCVLVDEFQDLNPVQYAVIRDIGRDHRHVFAVGDDEQSIYSWAGADPRVFLNFMNDFSLQHHVQLRENRRCPRAIVSRARRLIDINAPLLGRKQLDVDRESPFDITVRGFSDEDSEIAWVIEDLRRDREAHALSWGDYALLYRKHQIGDLAEAGLLSSGLPCRLAQGRAIGEDPVCEYVIAALAAVAHRDDLHDDAFLEVVLPSTLIDTARARAGTTRTLVDYLQHTANTLPREHGDAKKIKRALYTLRNLTALGRRHASIGTLVEEILSQRVGVYRTTLEEHHDALTDPAGDPEVVALADQLGEAVRTRQAVAIPRLGGAEIALKGMLAEIGVACQTEELPRHPEQSEGSALASGGESRSLAPLGMASPVAIFKAAQLLRMGTFRNEFRDFTAVDLETTDNKVASAEIVEIAAVRVRDGIIRDELSMLVRPRCPITAGATRAHGITDGDVAHASCLEEVWPQVAKFCSDDILVAHNGYQFDFPLLRRLTSADPCTYDTLPLARELHTGSAKLADLAARFGIDAGVSHRALDDARTLARVFLALGESKIVRARKTSLVHVLDYLGLALALWDGDIDDEAQLLRRLCRPFALGRYSDCLEYYRAEREAAGDTTLPTVREVIERLGGDEAMQRIRAERSASERYPVAMARLRRLLGQCSGESLGDQIADFLERVALSSKDGIVPARERVNLLTLHSTKGLEFSRVYILGVEDAQLPGGTPLHPASPNEIEEARRLLYVGMTRARDRLVLTRTDRRGGQRTGGHRFLDEMGLVVQ